MNTGARIRLAVERLVHAHPLLVVVFGQYVLAEGSTKTMGIGFAPGRGFRLYYDPDFVDILQLEHLEAVLHHEARHALFGHLLLEPEDHPDEWALTVAEEVTVNEGIENTLPLRPILLSDFPQLQSDEDTETRYRFLAKHSKSRPGNEIGMEIQTTDDHGPWEEVRENADEVTALIQTRLEAVAAGGSVRMADRTMLDELCATWGTEPMESLRPLGNGEGFHLDWRQLLRRFVGQVLQLEADLRRPPRRYPELLGVVPGRGSRMQRPVIQAVIDTSASIDEELLAEVVAELRRLGQSHDVIVVECDAYIGRVYRLTGSITAVTGGGGTDFRPPLECVFLLRTHADVVLYFTDGEGSFPDKPPQVPVLWCVTNENTWMPDWAQWIYIG